SEKTEIRMAYDDHYLYFSAKMYDSEVNGIQGNSLIRDLDLGGDFFNVLIDTYNDDENMLGFFTTPTGNRLDAEVINDAEGPDFWNMNWNSFWDTKVQLTDEGWFAEIRIPFSSLRFQDDNGKVIFGVIVHRLINRKNERLIFPAIPPKWNSARLKASKAQDVVLEGVYSKTPLYISPYLLTGMERSTEIIGSESRSENQFQKEVGLDLKYGLTNNLTLDLTVNTDFAQVEADNEQVNLSRFSLFFPEKRQFFQERSGIFNFNTGGETRLFHSRRIGLTDLGEPIRMLGGARLTGRINNWDLGFLDVQTAQQDSVPAENFGVLRVRRQVFNRRSYIGSLFTSRVGINGNNNFTYGIDGLVNVFGSDYLSLKWAQTQEDLPEQPSNVNFGNSSLAYFFWERRTLDGWGYSTEFTQAGEFYNPRTGFFLGNNFTTIKPSLRYGWKLQDHSWLLRHTPYITTIYTLRNLENSPKGNNLNLGWKFDLLSRAFLQMEFSYLKDKLVAPFVLSDAVQIPIGNYHFNQLSLIYQMSPGKNFRTNWSAQAGSFYDGNKISFTINPTWNLSRHFEIGADYEFNNIDFPGRNETFNSSVGRFRLRSALNVHLSLSGLIQYNSLDKRLGANVQTRYNFSEGNDLYLVYNEINHTGNDFSELGNLIQENRSITLKYIHTFIK
ncbi:MAG: DUF5916 domain-containing protein, partial [Bacteroidetes bacterium]|nr:DUF5916 domain-containing protein [Bacteroidota bacterium]